MSQGIVDSAGVVVGTSKGVVIEYLGGEKNGESCPEPTLDIHEDWMTDLQQDVKFRKLILPGVHHHGIIGYYKCDILIFVKYPESRESDELRGSDAW